MEIAMPIAVAMADTRHSVVAVADGVMRRLSGHIDWENAGLVSRLYAIFLGTLTIKGKFETRAEDKKQPANTRYGHLLYSIFLLFLFKLREIKAKLISFLSNF